MVIYRWGEKTGEIYGRLETRKASSMFVLPVIHLALFKPGGNVGSVTTNSASQISSRLSKAASDQNLHCLCAIFHQLVYRILIICQLFSCN